ncbi:MAG: cyclic nucleotide-binding domain-containing protein [Desulfobacula sp.]|jgi:CRP-like cAMP-binding protein
MIGPKFGTVKSYFKNKLIFQEGQPGNVGYLVKTGEVTIYKIIDGEKRILSRLGPGEVFGEMGIVTESPRTAYAEASEYCELVVIDKDTLLDMLKKSPKLIQSITLLLMKRLAGTLYMLDHQDDQAPGPKKLLGFYSLLELMARGNSNINYNFFSERVMDIVHMNQPEIDQLIKDLTQLKIAEVRGDHETMNTYGCTVKIIDTLSLQKKMKRIKQTLT